MKKLIALICVLAMVMAMSVSAFAIVSSSSETDYATEADDSSSSESDSKSEKSDSKDSTTTKETSSNDSAEAATNFVDNQIAAKAAEALAALLVGDLADYKPLTGWLKPDLELLKAELKKIQDQGYTDLKVVLYGAAGCQAIDAKEIDKPEFNLVGVEAVTVIGK